MIYYGPSMLFRALLGQLLQHDEEKVVVRCYHDLLVVPRSDAEEGQIVHRFDVADD